MELAGRPSLNYPPARLRNSAAQALLVMSLKIANLSLAHVAGVAVIAVAAVLLVR
jgi:hypothetical protein